MLLPAMVGHFRFVREKVNQGFDTGIRLGAASLGAVFSEMSVELRAQSSNSS